MPYPRFHRKVLSHAFRCENEFKRSNRFLPAARKNNLRHVVFVCCSTVLRLVRPKNRIPLHHARFYPHFRVCKTKRNTPPAGGVAQLTLNIASTPTNSPCFPFVRLNATPHFCKTKRNMYPFDRCVYFYNRQACIFPMRQHVHGLKKTPCCVILFFSGKKMLLLYIKFFARYFP